MEKEQEKFKLFANCIPVKGAKRFIICDIQRKCFFFINEGLYEVLIMCNGLSLNKIKSEYCNEDEDLYNIVYNNLLFLIENELGFFCSNPEQFPELKLDWNIPSLVSNIIIENSSIKHPFSRIITELNGIGCKFVELRFYNSLMENELIEVVSLFNDSKIRNINLILKYSKDIQDINFKEFLLNNQRIGYIIIHSVPVNIESFIPDVLNNRIELDVSIISSNIHCGIVTPSYFSPNLQHFTESQHHNTCLNRKISIDINGNIKNCPSMPESYGNIKDITLKEALERPGFKKYWNIKKDDITKCKDCEFRHICTDCRAYRDNPDDIYSAPLKCGYDPYTGEWEEWSTNPLKQKAINHYGMRGTLGFK